MQVDSKVGEYTITHSAGHPPCLPSLTILLSYFPTLTVHLLPILSLTQLDTLPLQCELRLRLLRLQQRQRRVLERGRWRLFLIDYFLL